MCLNPPNKVDSGTHKVPGQFSLRRLFWWVFCIGVLLAGLVALGNAVQNARRSAIAVASQCPFNQLQLALRNYHEVYGQFPPAYVADQNGKPMHSWRVLILPFVEEQALYDAYDFSQPWDSAKNARLANQMPRTFGTASEPESNTFTNVVAVTGPGTVFPGSQTTRIADFADALENTILLAEISNSRLPWLQPRDIDTQRARNLLDAPGELTISAVYWRRPYVVFADRIRGYTISADIPPEALRALTTIAGREPVTREQLLRQGFLK